MVLVIVKEKLSEAIVEIRTIKYWRKVANKFKRAHGNKTKILVLNVKHHSNIFSSFQPDDEMKIELYANKYGYRLLSESLGSKISTYKFELCNNLYNNLYNI